MSRTKTKNNPLLEKLKHHVTGAIERGEAMPIESQPMSHTKGLIKAAKYLAKESLKYKDIKPEELLNIWNDPKPHFDGHGQHRYDGTDKECCYCLRPKNYKAKGVK